MHDGDVMGTKARQEPLQRRHDDRACAFLKGIPEARHLGREEAGIRGLRMEEIFLHIDQHQSACVGRKHEW